MKKLFTAALALILLLAGCLSAASAEQEMRGKKLKNFKVKTIQGETFDLYKELETKDLVVIDLWFIDCDFCPRPMAYLNAIMPEYQDRVSFIALDVTNDSVKDMQFYAEKRGFTIPMAKDPGVRKAVKANERGYPYTVVVGKNATVLYNPFETDEAQLDGLRRMLDDMLSLTDEQYEHLAETDLDWYNTQVPYNSDEQKQIYLDYGHNFYIYNIRDNMNLTVSGEGVVPVVIDEGLELLKKTEMVGQFYLVKNSSHMVTATIETTEPFLANKANTEYYDPEKEDYVIKYFSKAKKGKNTYVFEIPVGTGVTWFDEKSSADRNRYGCVGFYTFMDKADIASYFKEIERRHGYTVKWHLGE